jgi:putative IMPACT (imprinted ancient) family translation regulator
VRDRGSRFLSRAGYAASVEEALAAREAERDRFHAATHHVFAYVPLESSESRCDDDGEPAGTAGRPSLRAIEAAGLSRTVVITTRYFGGTKLGTGGLVRAYAAAATAAIEGLAVRRVVPGLPVRLRFAYHDTGAIMRVLEAAGVRRVSERYDQATELEVEVARHELDRLTRLLRDATAGRAQVDAGEGVVLIPLRS